MTADSPQAEREAALRGNATLVEARDDVMTAVRTGEGLASALAVLELVARAAGRVEREPESLRLMEWKNLALQLDVKNKAMEKALREIAEELEELVRLYGNPNTINFDPELASSASKLAAKARAFFREPGEGVTA